MSNENKPKLVGYREFIMTIWDEEGLVSIFLMPGASLLWILARCGIIWRK